MSKSNPHLERAIRKLGGLTRTSLALGCSTSAINHWRRAGRVFRPCWALRLAKLSGVELRFLLGDGGPAELRSRRSSSTAA